MKLIQGQYVMPSGTSINIERHNNGAAPRVSVSVNLCPRHIFPCALVRRVTYDQLTDMLRGPIEAIWGGPLLDVYNSVHREDIRKFVQTVEAYSQ